MISSSFPRKFYWPVESSSGGASNDNSVGIASAIVTEMVCRTVSVSWMANLRIITRFVKEKNLIIFIPNSPPTVQIQQEGKPGNQRWPDRNYKHWPMDRNGILSRTVPMDNQRWVHYTRNRLHMWRNRSRTLVAWDPLRQHMDEECFVEPMQPRLARANQSTWTSLRAQKRESSYTWNSWKFLHNFSLLLFLWLQNSAC